MTNKNDGFDVISGDVSSSSSSATTRLTRTRSSVALNISSSESQHSTVTPSISSSSSSSLQPQLVFPFEPWVKKRTVKRRTPPLPRAPPLPKYICLVPLVFCTIGVVIGFATFSSYHPPQRLINCISKDELSKCSVHPSKVFIAVMSDAGLYHIKAKSANDTWVKRARELGMKVKFFGVIPDDSLPAIGIVPFAERNDTKKMRAYRGLPGGGNNKRTFAMFEWVFDNEPEADFIMKCDDDTFVHPDMLLFDLLCHEDPHANHFIGQRGASLSSKGIFAGGGSGYILSRESLRLLLLRRSLGECDDLVAEDVTVSKCLISAGIKLKDYYGLHPETPRHSWLRSLLFNVPKLDLSPRFVTYHHMSPHEFYDANELAFSHCKG
eukprot:TRINITY_DN12955_c0_g1_i1.p1 TRINITY_DN12955_c0_g1~~TRINITY_DN12955_c0_g1_i1.p1  ORF type:complete len:380 (+),score=61.55 TRINITY_DN12955_c0_g1_i1:381-1520(+)